MKRELLQDLRIWKTSHSRKPLILKGARQVGKTFILQEFGNSDYENTAYLNFETTPGLHELFSGNHKPLDIIKTLAIELSIDIIPEKTLIIFDEIQACPAALNSLKYFNELASQYHIIAAGSLLGVTLANSKGFPVGQVDFMNLYPLSFNEFLQAKKEDKLIQYMEEMHVIDPLPDMLHEKLLKLSKEYLYTGGMPAAVLEYTQSEDLNRVRAIQKNILEAYRLDFAKHAPHNAIMKINQVWDVIPSQLAKENKKFIYSIIRQGARAKEFEIAIQWLVEAGLIHKVYHVSTPKLPLKAHVHFDIFKLFTCDVGLLGAMTDLSAKAIIYGNQILQEFKGALFENFVVQELARQEYGKYYWTSEGQAELDFLLQENDMIYPLEVKSGLSARKKSLLIYMQKYHPTLAIRISPMNLKLDGQLLNCPLYMLSKIKKILKQIDSE